MSSLQVILTGGVITSTAVKQLTDKLHAAALYTPAQKTREIMHVLTHPHLSSLSLSLSISYYYLFLLPLFYHVSNLS